MARCAPPIALLLLVACVPRPPSQIAHLPGEIVTAPVDDWSFARLSLTIRVETERESPYPMSLWFVAEGPRLWIYGDVSDRTPWAQAIRADGRVRITVDGKLYARTAVLVSNEVEIARVERLFYEKYSMRSLSNSDAQPLYYRLDAR